VRGLLVLALAASPFACVRATPQAPPPRVATPPPLASSASAAKAATAPDPLPSLDAIAARGASVAPGMRAVGREEQKLASAARFDAVPKAERDVCARLLFVATAPVRARLEDGAGDVLAELARPAGSGLLGERGPVCTRRGDVIRVAFQPDPAVAARVRWVTWASP
jgi:hypothetical protein